MSSSLGAGGQRGVWRGGSRGGAVAGGQAVLGGAARGRGGKRPRDQSAAAPFGDPDADAALLVQLSDTRRAKVFAMHSGVGALLDIREMYERDELTYRLPGKKGISLTLAQVEKLVDAGQAILAKMRELAATSGAKKAGEAGSSESSDSE